MFAEQLWGLEQTLRVATLSLINDVVPFAPLLGLRVDLRPRTAATVGAALAVRPEELDDDGGVEDQPEEERPEEDDDAVEHVDAEDVVDGSCSWRSRTRPCSTSVLAAPMWRWC